MSNKITVVDNDITVQVVEGSVSSAWGDITGTLANQTDLQAALDGKVDENAAIVGATKTKITYDAKGLVTAGADAAIADITGLQTALDGKVDENAAIVGATKTKITYDAKGLVTAGADAVYSDFSFLPTQSGQNGKYLTTDGNTLAWGTVSTANIYNSDGSLTANRALTLNGAYLRFVGSTHTSQFTAAGRLLLGTVSETTFLLDVNGTARIQGNLTTNLIPGSIPFIGANNILSDNNTKLFWDNTNTRLGINTNTPTSDIHISGFEQTNSHIRFGAVEFQSYTVNNSWLGDNMYFNGTSFILRNAGYGCWINFVGAETHLRFANTGAAGSTVSGFGRTNLKVNYDGTFALGQGMSDQISNYTGAKLLFNGSTGRLLIGTTTESTFLLDVNGTTRTNNVVIKPQSAAPTATAGALYYDSDDNKLKLYDGNNWVDLN